MEILMAKESAERDLRVPVLLLLGAIILAISFFSPEPKLRASDYYLAPATHGGRAEVVRLPKTQAINQAIQSEHSGLLAITPDLPCEKIPPELALLFHLPLPINRADQDQLIQLRGIGPKLSARIISFREEQGPITGPEDFIRIKGIGPKMTARLTPLLCFAAAEKKS
jgi:hypothetical protein